jgi:hypothetical protein
MLRVRAVRYRIWVDCKGPSALRAGSPINLASFSSIFLYRTRGSLQATMKAGPAGVVGRLRRSIPNRHEWVGAAFSFGCSPDA